LKYLLDSNVCIALMRRTPKVGERFLKHHLCDVATCAIVAAELMAGAYLSQARGRNLEVTRDFLSSMHQYPFDDACVEHYGELRARLTRAGQLIGPNDLLIAATALAHGAILVTHNTAEFSRVPGLLIEDWEA
jgi:tRNA(fMet)-specific endonuclease VapC